MTTNTDPLRDDVVPGGAWEFDDEVAAKFDDMLARSIPGLPVLRELTPRIAAISLNSRGLAGAHVLDIGTSRGAALDPFVEAGAHCLGLEVSEPMYEIARERFAPYPNAEVWNVEAREFARRQVRDREPFPLRYDVVLAILTLQFVPIEHRPGFLRDLYRITNPGGVLIVAEKILEPNPWADALTVEAYVEHKTRNGYTAEQITTKAKALEGVLVPLPAETNRRLVEEAGWVDVTTFWRVLSFEAFVARKAGYR